MNYLVALCLLAEKRFDFLVEDGFDRLAIRPLHASLLERVEQLMDGVAVALAEEFLAMLLDHLADSFVNFLSVHVDSNTTGLLQQGHTQLDITRQMDLDSGIVGELLQIGDCFCHLEIALHLVLHHPLKKKGAVLLRRLREHHCDIAARDEISPKPRTSDFPSFYPIRSTLPPP